MRVLMIAQALDPQGDVRAFILTWVRGLAAKVEKLSVLTLEQRSSALPTNVAVFSLGKERGLNKAALLLNFYRGLLKFLPTTDLVFVHMSPRFVWLAWPLCLVFGRKIVLWFVHPKKSCELRLALMAASRVLSVSSDSFALNSPKVVGIGHGIDLESYQSKTFQDAGHKKEDLLVCVGRLMPIKDQLTLIQALPHLPKLKLALIGGVPAGVDRSYELQLRQTVSDLGLNERVSFEGNLDAAQVASWYQRASLSVNLTQTGSFDKVVLESLAAGLPCLVRSRSFATLLGEYGAELLLPDDSGVALLVKAIKNIFAMDSVRRAQMAESLRARVIRDYSLENLISKLVRELEQVVGGR